MSSPESGQGNPGVQSLDEHTPSEEEGGEEQGVDLSLCCLKAGCHPCDLGEGAGVSPSGCQSFGNRSSLSLRGTYKYII